MSDYRTTPPPDAHAASIDDHADLTPQLNAHAARQTAALTPEQRDVVDRVRARMDALRGPGRPRGGGPSLSERGARLAIDTGISLAAAATAVGVSPQAVSQAYARIVGGATPLRRAKLAEIEAALELIAAGRSVTQVHESTGIHRDALRRHAKGRGIATSDGRASQIAESIAAAVEAVRGGATCAVAASSHGLSEAHLRRALRRANVRSTGKPEGVADGRVDRALARVDRGVSISVAARLEGCTYNAIRRRLIRRAAI